MAHADAYAYAYANAHAELTTKEGIIHYVWHGTTRRKDHNPLVPYISV